MTCFRIAHKNYADLNGIGAKIHGGRWNSKGTPAVYFGDNVSLYVCESLVHFDTNFVPKGMVLMTVEFPDDEILLQFENHVFKSSTDSRILGDRWLQSYESLAIKVPSIIMPYSYNYVVNPVHPAFKHVKISHTEPFDFDIRLIKK